MALKLQTLARQVYGRAAFVCHHPERLDAAGREAVDKRWRQFIATREQLRGAIQTLGDADGGLRFAARRALDATPGATNWAQVRIATERAERLAALQAELAEVLAELADLPARTSLYRFEVHMARAEGAFGHSDVLLTADTREELAEQLQALEQSDKAAPARAAQRLRRGLAAAW